MKKVLIGALLTFVVAIDIYLVYTLILNDHPPQAQKEIITTEENNEKSSNKVKEIIKPTETQVIKTETKKIKTENKEKQPIQNKITKKEIDHLIEKIIEEAKMEYHFKKEKKEGKNIIDRLFPFRN